jgi:nanoRNase/pAp phosphatase (c-di-AMP/oligoRNAs hydrolase)
MSIDWQPLQRIVDRHQRFVISSHVKPDADAVGSEVGLALLLDQQGKSVRVVNTSATPPHLLFLDPEGRVEQFGAGDTAAAVTQAEVHLIVDTSSWSQLSEVGVAMKSTAATRVVIDHHVSADDLGAVEFKDPTREATGALVTELAESLGWPIPPLAATALFAAVATDTGWFRFASTTDQTLQMAGRLIGCGARPHEIFRELYERASLARLHLVGRALERIVVDCDGQLAYTQIPWSDFAELGATPADTEDLVNECLKIAGTKAAFIAIETPTRQVKVSFRSRTDVDVAKVAEQFGGGGHKQASGATLAGPLRAALQQALTAMRQALAANVA